MTDSSVLAQEKQKLAFCFVGLYTNVSSSLTPKTGNNSNAHQQMNKETLGNSIIQWNITQQQQKKKE
jgi:hypothetical protein